MYEKYAELRDSLHLSDYAVSKKTGVGRSTLSEWKNGKHVPNRDNLKLIANFLGCTIDYLIDETVEMEFQRTGVLDNVKNYVSPVAKMQSELSDKLDSHSLDETLVDLMKIYKKLNENGCKALLDYAEFLLQKPEFKKVDSESLKEA